MPTTNPLRTNESFTQRRHIIHVSAIAASCEVLTVTENVV